MRLPSSLRIGRLITCDFIDTRNADDVAAVLRPLGDSLTTELLLRHPAYQHRDPDRFPLELEAADQLAAEVAQWIELADNVITNVRAGHQKDDLISTLYSHAESLWGRITKAKMGL